jgi:trans-aconitate 2-methyltransferase
LHSWDPEKYLKFVDHRLRPALDLMAQIRLDAPRTIYDLGCGPGNVTRLLAERWPEARITGVDFSVEMLDRARREAPAIRFVEADIAEWSAPEPADLLFSNAALHWLDDHARLLPRLMRQLAPGGVFAVQMPHNAEAHALVDSLVNGERWRGRLSQVRGVLGAVDTSTEYYRVLAPLARRVDIWETEYVHVLAGENPVVEWMEGTVLRPYLDVLGSADREAFLTEYATRIAAAYPKQPDGRTLLHYRRLFFIAEM